MASEVKIDTNGRGITVFAKLDAVGDGWHYPETSFEFSLPGDLAIKMAEEILSRRDEIRQKTIEQAEREVESHRSEAREIQIKAEEAAVRLAALRAAK